MESSVTVFRTSPEDVQQRQIILTLDDQPFATLLYGEKATRGIVPGPHRLRADNTWVWKTIVFDLAPGQHLTFRVINRAGRLTWWMIAIIGAGPMYVTLDPFPPESV